MATDAENQMINNTVNLERNLRNFIYHVDNLLEEEDMAGNGFNREYRELRKIADDAREEGTYSAIDGRRPENIKKNRYKDIIPYDETRVILNEDESKPGSDYINANRIMNVHGNDGYLATQGPLEHTIVDFWRMIWEYKVKAIIMVCKLKENGKSKCEQYWPDECGEDGELTLEPFKVQLIEEHNIADDCFVRKMKLFLGDEVSFVNQLHYTGWPDHGIPDDITVILAMIKTMREIRESDINHSAVVVHCSAGCGRTGTICAIDYAWEVLKSGKLTKDFSLFEIVKIMREQRQSMIQTPDQYEVAHLAVKELFNRHIEVMEENVYANEDGEEETEEGEETKENEDGKEAGTNSGSIYSLAVVTKSIENEAVSAVELYKNKTSLEPPLQASPNQPPLPCKNKTATLVQDIEFKPEAPKKPEQYANIIKTDRYENVSRIQEHSPPKEIVKPLRNSVRSHSEKTQEKIERNVRSSLSSDMPSNIEGPVFIAASRKSEPVVTRSVVEQNGQKKHTTIIHCSNDPVYSFAKASDMTPSATPTQASTTDKPNNRPVSMPKDSKLQFKFTDQTSSSRVAGNSKVDNPSDASIPPGDGAHAEIRKSLPPAHGAEKTQTNSNTSNNEYSTVDISKKTTTKKQEENPYELASVRRTSDSETTTPVIPPRNYSDPEESHQKPDKHESKMTAFKNFLKGKPKDKGTPVNSTHIPGFNQRYDKQPHGPRDPPDWSKKKNVISEKM